MQRNSTCSRAYPYKCLTFGCLATAGVSNFRWHSNGGIRPNTSHYYCLFYYHQHIVAVCAFVWVVTSSCCAGVSMTVPMCVFGQLPDPALLVYDRPCVRVWAVTRPCSAGVCMSVAVCVFGQLPDPTLLVYVRRCVHVWVVTS
jgi:hypothetical protein